MTPPEETTPTILRLPRDLGNGLLLRWGRPEEAEALGNFNVAIHSENPQDPETWLLDWTRDLMSGRHPTTSASDFTLVVDEAAGGKIVSSLNLISQTWTYDGVPFGVGRIELVGTDREYRRQGLVREQMAVIHALSAARGEVLQAITGIPWYYRQFGYEMTINLGGARELFWSRPDNDQSIQEEHLRLRAVHEDDIPTLNALYEQHCGDSLIVRPRDEEQWTYELFGATQGTEGRKTIEVVEVEDGSVVAYVNLFTRGGAFIVRELGVKKGHSWREIGLFLSRALRARAVEINRERQKPIDHISFDLGDQHALYEALDPQLEGQRRPYAWYIRVPDLPAFLSLITPALERRLGESVMAGHSGLLRLNLYRSGVVLAFDQGRLLEISAYQPDRFHDCDAAVEELTFLQLLFGYRSIDELEATFADCILFNPEGRVMLRALFPRRPSNISPLF